MKKRILMAVFAALTLVACMATAACTGNTDSTGGSVADSTNGSVADSTGGSVADSTNGSVADSTDSTSGNTQAGADITETDWNRMVLLDSLDNFSMQVDLIVRSDMWEEAYMMSAVYRFDGNKYHVEDGNGEISEYVLESYIEVTGEPDENGMVACIRYTRWNDDESWTAEETSTMLHDGMDAYVTEFTYDKFEYDAESGLYINKEPIEINPFGPVITQNVVKINFSENGSVVISISGTTQLQEGSPERGTMEMTITVFDIGTTSVSLPVVAAQAD